MTTTRSRKSSTGEDEQAPSKLALVLLGENQHRSCLAEKGELAWGLLEVATLASEQEPQPSASDGGAHKARGS
jgi:hypothetical protein